MRSTDERIAAVGRRTRELKQRQKLRHSRIAALSSIAAGLALIIGIGFAMPGIMANMNSSQYLGPSGMASVFSSGSGIGYVVIALLAFALGVCVTMFCLHLHHTARKAELREENPEERDD